MSIQKNINFTKYLLAMFPYPTGFLHAGHLRVYSFIDLVKRFYSMCGETVFSPIGWDAVGLPAEIAAIKHKKNPFQWTEENISQMKIDLKNFQLEFSDNSMSTLDPKYVYFEQKIFSWMFKQGLIYKDYKLCNYCNNCSTILSNEQSENNKCWRCNEILVLKKTEQFFIRISLYAEQLYLELKCLGDDLTQKTGWDSAVFQRQLNWLGEYVYPCFFNNKYFNISENLLKKYLINYNISSNLNIITPDNIKNIDKFIQSIQEVSASNSQYYFKSHLEDWCISRQRWGTPIPLIECNNCGLFYDNNVDFSFPTYEITVFGSKYTDIICPLCNLSAKKVSHTLDTFFASSWYMYRFPEIHNQLKPFSNPELKIDLYVGGAEHATSHLIYTRFFQLFFKKIDLISKNVEVLPKFLSVGIVNGLSIFCNICNSYSICDHDKKDKIMKVEKMSKSKGNAVNLNELLNNFTPEMIKLYILSVGPINKIFTWDTNSINGIKRLFNKIEKLLDIDNLFSKELELQLNIIYSEILYCFENMMQFNNFRVFLCTLVNLNNLGNLQQKQKFLLILYLICPNLAKYFNDKYNFQIKNWKFDNSFIRLYKYLLVMNNNTTKIWSENIINNQETFLLYCKKNNLILPDNITISLEKFIIKIK